MINPCVLRTAHCALRTNAAALTLQPPLFQCREKRVPSIVRAAISHSAGTSSRTDRAKWIFSTAALTAATRASHMATAAVAP